jgi:tetratricopeptide (TPR) repeat protein
MEDAMRHLSKWFVWLSLTTASSVFATPAIESFSDVSALEGWTAFTNDENTRDGWIAENGLLTQNAANEDQETWGERLLLQNNDACVVPLGGSLTVSVDLNILEFRGQQGIWQGMLLFMDPTQPTSRDGVYIIIEWAPQDDVTGLRVYHKDWKSDLIPLNREILRWERLKVQIDNPSMDSLSLKAKVWSYDDAEPEDWMLETDLPETVNPSRTGVALATSAQYGYMRNPYVGFDNLVVSDTATYTDPEAPSDWLTNRYDSQQVDVLPPTTPDFVYGVQLAASHSGNLQEVMDQWTAKGYDALWVEEGEERSRLFLGPFPTFVDALLVKQDINSDPTTQSNVFIRRFDDPQREVAASIPVESVFNLATGETASSLREQSLENNSRANSLEGNNVSGNREAFWALLDQELPTVSVDDPLKGYILTKLSLRDFSADNYEQALAKVQPVAEGTVAASVEDRTTAMIRTAIIYHYHQVDRVKAYRAYREIQRFTTDKAVQDRCRVACVGLLMELAESKKGTHEEMRREAKLAFQNVGDNIKAQAVIELMYSETYSRQPIPDFQTAARLSERIIERYTPLDRDGTLTRELITATRQAGMYFRKTGDLDASYHYYQKVLEDFPVDGPKFRHHDQHAGALMGLSWVAHRMGDFEMVRQIQRDVLELYPEEQAAETILRRYPNIRSDLAPSWESETRN